MIDIIFKKIIGFYKITAIMLLNILIFFILVNFAASAYLRIKEKYSNKENPVVSKYGQDPLMQVYPDLQRHEIDDMLREIWNRPYVFESWTGLKERPYKGKYVNVDENGYRITKNQGPWPPDKKKYFTVFLFGGSTTFGYGVPDYQTIASYLQEILSTIGSGKDVRVYNFGRGYYYSTQERILFEQLISSGFIPDLAVFIDGLNDFGFSYGDWQFSARFKMLFEQQLSKPEEYYHWRMLKNKLPLLKLRSKIATAVDNDKEELVKNKNLETEVNNIIQRYLNNKKMIEAVADSFGIKTVFVWQPASFYKYGMEYQLFYQPPDPRGVLGYSEMAKVVNQINLGNNFLCCADIQEDLKEPLYVDNVHYSAKMSKILAQYIVDWMVKNNYDFN